MTLGSDAQLAFSSKFFSQAMLGQAPLDWLVSTASKPGFMPPPHPPPLAPAETERRITTGTGWPLWRSKPLNRVAQNTQNILRQLGIAAIASEEGSKFILKCTTKRDDHFAII